MTTRIDHFSEKGLCLKRYDPLLTVAIVLDILSSDT